MKLYRALLRLLPLDFRVEHGREMEQIVRLQGNWIGAIVDVIKIAPSQHFAMLRQDVGYALHTLRRAPGFAAAALITLAIGISGSASIFTVLNAFLFRPLPVSHPEQLVSISSLDHHIEMPHGVSYADLRDYEKLPDVFSGVFGYQAQGVWIESDGAIDRIIVEAMTDNAFGVLGLNAAMGRTFSEADTRTPVIVLTHDYWRSRFNGDETIIGKVVRVQQRPFTVIGVTPPEFTGLESLAQVSAFVPLTAVRSTYGGESWMEARDAHALWVMGRLKAGVSIDQARAAVNVRSRALAAQYPQTNADVSMLVVPETWARPVPQNGPMFHVVAVVLSVLAMLLLVIASANLANMLLARASTRGREMAVRAALGARQGRIVRQLVTEGLVLAVLGSGVAIVVTMFVSSAMARGLTNMSIEAPIRVDFGIDWRVVAVTLAVATFAGVLSSVAPAMYARRADVNSLLKSGGRSIAGGDRGWIRRALIVAQVAVSLVLLIVGGLFVKTSAKARTVDLGFRSNDVLMARLDLSRAYPEEKRPAYMKEVRDRVLALPGVQGAAWISSPPFSITQDLYRVRAEGQAVDPSLALSSFAVSVGPEYFSTMTVPMVAGRPIDERDGWNTPRVIVVNEALAQLMWPGEDPIGKPLFLSNDTTPYEVVGLVKTGKYILLWEAARPMLFQSIEQIAPPTVTLEVATSGRAEAFTDSLRTAIQRFDPGVPLFRIVAMSEHLEKGSAFVAFNMGALYTGLFGVLGLLLASVGLYGVVAFDVNRRTHEIGVRMALGAGRGQLLRGVVMRGARLAIVGLVVGTALAASVAWPMRNLFLGVSPFDVPTYALTGAILLGVCLVASLIPAQRAAAANPLDTLRAD